MKKLLLGIAIGAGAVYFMDPTHGDERRRKLVGMWDENKDTVLGVTSTVGSAAQTAGSLAGEKFTELKSKVSDEGNKTGTNGGSGSDFSSDFPKDFAASAGVKAPDTGA